LKLTQTDTLPTSEDPDEGELIREAQRDPAAFEPLYDHYVRGLYRYVLSRVGTSTEAEDVTSQTFLSALEALPRYHHRGRFAAWLYTIARRKITDHFRRPAIADSQSDAPDSLPGSIEHVVGLEELDRLRSLVRELSEESQELIRLRYTASLPFAEIAAVVGKREDSVKKTVYRALARMRSELEGEDA
jgi:RNA polymerase sigma-70 factor (ECF subfamily)